MPKNSSMSGFRIDSIDFTGRKKKKDREIKSTQFYTKLAKAKAPLDLKTNQVFTRGDIMLNPMQ